MNTSSKIFGALAAASLALAAVRPAHAYHATYNVSVGVSSLAGVSSAKPFYAYFGLVDGGTPGGSQVTITGFNFGAGGAASADTLGDTQFTSIQGASGGLSGGSVTLQEPAFGGPDTYLFQQFTPGNQLSFQLDLTNDSVFDPAALDDSFVFTLLDGSQAPIPTLDPLFSDSLVAIDFNGDSGTAQSYASDPSRPLPTGGNTPILNPVVTPGAAAAVPEPSTTGALGVFAVLMLCAIAAARRTAKRTHLTLKGIK